MECARQIGSHLFQCTICICVCSFVRVNLLRWLAVQIIRKPFSGWKQLENPYRWQQKHKCMQKAQNQRKQIMCVHDGRAIHFTLGIQINAYTRRLEVNRLHAKFINISPFHGSFQSYLQKHHMRKESYAEANGAKQPYLVRHSTWDTIATAAHILHVAFLCIATNKYERTKKLIKWIKHTETKSSIVVFSSLSSSSSFYECVAWVYLCVRAIKPKKDKRKENNNIDNSNRNNIKMQTHERTFLFSRFARNTLLSPRTRRTS